MNWLSFKKSPVLEDHFYFVPKKTWQCNFDWIKNCLPFRITWVHTWNLVGCVLLNLKLVFCVVFCTSLFVVLFLFCHCVVFDLLILISPLVSSSRRMKSKRGNRRSEALEKSAVANLYEINVYVSIVFSAFKTSVQNYSGNTTNVLYQ